MINFAKHPYIDIRACFNSFIPKDLPEQIAERVVNFCLSWLENNPELHDKVEFEVIPTCYDLDFARWEKRFSYQNSFTPSEIKHIRESYISLTKKAFQRNKKDLDVIKQLEKRYQIIKGCDLSTEKAFVLLEDARRYGAIPLHIWPQCICGSINSSFGRL